MAKGRIVSLLVNVMTSTVVMTAFVAGIGSATAADYGTCSGVLPDGPEVQLKKEHARAVAGSEWIGRWCNPNLQGTHNDPKGELIRRFAMLPFEGLYSFGSVMIESYFTEFAACPDGRRTAVSRRASS